MYLLRFLKLRTILIALTVVMSQYVLAAVGHNTVHLDDNSDWWSLHSPGHSLFSSNISSQALKPQKRGMPESYCQILGIRLDVSLYGSIRKYNESIWKEVMTKLGKATVVSRGDATGHRHQVCYVSAGSKEKVYLIFEDGDLIFEGGKGDCEISESFYLFADGPSWKGDDYSVRSSLVSSKLTTVSGLHLGQTQKQVMAILGKPNLYGKNELFYSFRPKTDPPDPCSNVEIYAKFTNSKLAYLAVSRSTGD